jgi:hypothetical protein
MRLSKDLHHIFFDCKPCNEICPENYLEPTHDLICSICGARAEGYSDDPRDIKHGTPPFLQSLDAMQLIVESGKFAEIREEFFHWLPQTGKPPYECRALTYNRKRLGNRMYFTGKGHSRQEAFYLAALASQGHTVIKEENNEHNEIH